MYLDPPQKKKKMTTMTAKNAFVQVYNISPSTTDRMWH